MSQTPRFQSTADLFDGWRDDVLSGKGPTLYPVGAGELARIEIGPGLVTLIGGAPGAGKTALTLQWTFDALMLTPGLRALVCNVEMSPTTLLDRQLARLSGIDLTLIRHRRLTAGHGDAIARGMQALDGLGDRLAFVRPPFDLRNVAASADAFGASLIVLDYIQRIGAAGSHDDRRGAVGETMSYIRQFADAGVAIIVVAALARSKDAKGRSSYTDGLSLASFRETSELEYGADDAFILARADDESEGDVPSVVVLKHLKSRYGETRDIVLNFDRPHQRFTVEPAAGPAPRADPGRLTAALQAMWDRTAPARDEEGNA
jgi:replicative DNA helicase